MKGLCIMLIIINHADDRVFALAGENTNYVLESFRIPMYYFISGLFFRTYNGFGDFARRKVNNIIVPMVFFYILSCLVIGVAQWIPPLHRTYGSFKWSMLIDPLVQRWWRANVPMWFLLSLFEVNLLCYAIHRYVCSRWMRVGIVLILSLFGYALSTRHSPVPLLLDTALLGIPYFMLGTCAMRHGALDTRQPDRWGVLAFVIVLGCIYPIAQEINLWRQELPPYLYLYIVPAVSILSLTWACKRLPYVPVVCYIGRYSLVVLCTHFPLMRLVERMVMHLSPCPTSIATSMVTIATILFIELPIIHLFIRFLPRFTAQKPLFDNGWKLSLHDGR